MKYRDASSASRIELHSAALALSTASSRNTCSLRRRYGGRAKRSSAFFRSRASATSRWLYEMKASNGTTRVHSTAGVGRLQLSPVLAPQSLEVAPVEHGDDLAVEQAQLPDLLVLAVRVRLPHRRALDVGVGVREVEVGRERLPQAPVVVVLELERVGLVLPGDAVRV